MLPLDEERPFTFRFADDRILYRFHLEGVPAGRQVSVFQIDPRTGERLDLLVAAAVSAGGWVDLKKPILIQAGEALIVVPDLGRLKHSPGKMVLYGIGVVGVLALAGYFCGLAQGGGNGLLLAVCCAAIGAFIVLLGYGPVALLIGALGTLAEQLHGKSRPRTVQRGPTQRDEGAGAE
jgi:hypothetical protein